METQKGFITELAELVDRHRARRSASASASEVSRSRWKATAHWLLPNGGTIILITLLILTQSVWAQNRSAPNSSSMTAISYQGRLLDSNGLPVDDSGLSMTFRLYNTDTGGVPLWSEGQISVPVQDGLFHVLLGSIEPIPVVLLADSGTLWLGVQIGTDTEMSPREQIASVPYAIVASTVLNAGITTEKIADQAVTQAKLGPDVNLLPPPGSITTTMIADGAVTGSKLAPGTLDITGDLAVTGNVSLGGTLDGPYAYWADYRSYIRLLAASGANAANLCPEGGEPVGIVSPKQSINFRTGFEIAQANYPNAGTCVNVHSFAACGSLMADAIYPYAAESCSEDFQGQWAPFYWWNGEPSDDVTYTLLGQGIGCRLIRYACVQITP